MLTEWVTRIDWKCRPARKMSPNQTPVSCADAKKKRIREINCATISTLIAHRIVNVSTIADRPLHHAGPAEPLIDGDDADDAAPPPTPPA